MNLPDARRTERVGVEAGKDLLDRGAELPLDYGLGGPSRHGPHRVLQLRELGEHPLGQDVRAGGEQLSELDECRPEVVKGLPEAHAEVRREELLEPFLLPPVPANVEDEPEPVPDEDAPYLGETPKTPRRGCCSASHRRIRLQAGRGLRLVARRLGSHVGAGRRGLGPGHALRSAGARRRRDG